MRCKVCGTEVKENQRFCPTCGLLIDLSFSPFQNIEVQPEPEKDEEPEFLKQQMLAQEEAESEEESVENLPLKKNVDEFLEEQKEAGELEYAPEEEPIQENSVQDNLEKDIPEQEKLEQSLSTQEFLSQEELSQEELSQEEVLEEDVSQKELEEKAVQAEAVKESVASEEKEETDTAALSKEQEETGTDTLSGEKEEIDRDALSEEQEEASFIEAFFREKEEHGEEESQPEETQVQESIQEEAEQEGLKEETSEQEISAQEEAGIQEFVPEVFTEEDSKEDSHGDELQEKEPQKDESQEDEPQEDESQEDESQEDESQEDESQEDELQEKDPQEEESQEEEGPLEDESITLIERGLFREEVQEDEEEPEEKILSLQEKRKEMEEKLAFEGEIPDDPDDFQDKAAIPPTSVGEWKKGWQKWKKAAPLAIIPVLGIAYICYQNLPATQYDNLLKKGTKLVQSEKGDEAIALLEGMPSNLTKNSKYYLLLSEAYGKAGRHQEAVKALEEAKKLYPEDTEVQTALSLLDPKVESDLQGDSFTDPVEISLKSSGKKIIYSISGGKEDIQNEEYLAPIKLSRNGNYTLTAYAQASDGSMGESYSKSFSISLDPEKYHLSQFVDEEGGRSYIDENGDRVTGWKEIAGKYYYFDENGIMQSGFQDIGGERYYLNSDGTMQTGRLDLEGKTYFFDQDGHMIKDAWVDNLYYVGEDGVMLRNQENKEGVHFDEDGRRAFLAADLYAAHPDSIVVVESKQRKEKSSYYLFPAKIYYQKKNGRASGKVAYETEIKVSKMAMMSYLDENLPSITAKDAVSFLPTLSMQNIKQNKDGVVTSFAFVLGERRS
nr:tetratricopeptide repeat protein [uncultured Oribacterium sp.]